MYISLNAHHVYLFVCLCFTSHRQRDHLETAPPFAKDVKLGKYTVQTGNRTPGRRMAVHYTTAAPRKLHSHTMLMLPYASAVTRAYFSTYKHASHYTILSCDTLQLPCDADIVTVSCSVRRSAIPSVTILKIGRNRSPS